MGRLLRVGVILLLGFGAFTTRVDAQSGSGDRGRGGQLGQNYPNPFNPATTIRFDVPRSSHVRLSVFDVQGREIAVLVDEVKAVGSHDVTFDAGALSSGVYLYRLQTDGFSEARVLSLLK